MDSDHLIIKDLIDSVILWEIYTISYLLETSYMSKGAIHVINIELPTKSNTSDSTDEKDNWWEYNIAEQFPVKSRREANGPTHIEVDKPHEGCLIKTTMKNGKMDGESSIYSKDNILMATLTFVDGIASGPCTICKNGILFYKGYFVNGYREGRGQEYDENGKVVYDGYYKKGKKQNIVPSNEMGKGYWKELDEHGRIIQISQKDEFGNNEGFCYSYDCGKISRVSVWNKGKEETLLKEFRYNIMIEYENGRKVYEGGFVDSLEMGYPRNDDNIRVVKTGTTNIQKDNFKIIIHNSKTERLCGSLLKNKYIYVVVAVISIILFDIYFIAYYLNKGLHGIGYKQESYIVESGYGKYVTTFELSNYPNLKRIEIGNNCFVKVKSFQIDGLNRLKTIKIAHNSFTQKKYGNDASKSFHILNCESLESIQIGESSFSDFAGEFELKNLPQLQSIQIGTIGRWSSSCNFYYSSFVIRGIELILNIVMIRSSKSTIHYIR